MAYARHCIIGAVQACLICLAPARAQAQENPGFPDPAQTGFHNAALVYAESSLNAESARPLFSCQDATGKATPSEPLFDAAKRAIDDQDRPALSIGPLEPVCRQFLNSCKNPIRIHRLCSSMSPWVGSRLISIVDGRYHPTRLCTCQCINQLETRRPPPTLRIRSAPIHHLALLSQAESASRGRLIADSVQRRRRAPGPPPAT